MTLGDKSNMEPTLYYLRWDWISDSERKMRDKGNFKTLR